MNYSLQSNGTGKLGNGYKGPQQYYLLKLHVTLWLSQNRKFDILKSATLTIWENLNMNWISDNIREWLLMFYRTTSLFWGDAHWSI